MSCNHGRLSEEMAKPAFPRGANVECPACNGDGGYYTNEPVKHTVYLDDNPTGYEPAFIRTSTNGVRLLQQVLQAYLPEPHEADLYRVLLAAFKHPR